MARRSVSPSTERAETGRPGRCSWQPSPARRPLSYLLAVPDAVLEGAALTAFLDRVAPFGCPPPPSLIRAYSLPDAPYPSILLKEHGDAPAGTGDAYRRFAAHARLHWLAALQETGPGLVPALAWQTGPVRRFVALDEWAGALGERRHRLVGPGR